jgi:manganese-dependent inorganic pyrophosphatase
MEEIIIIGHKNPDTDSIVSAIGLAYLKNNENNLKERKFIPARCGELNEETKFVLSQANLEEPILIEDITEKSVILVDHNEFSQAADGIEKAKIISIVDHHKINFSYPEPIHCHTEPVGSTSTIVADWLLNSNIKIEKNLAIALLGGILSDTVVFKSSTTTQKDKDIAEQLAKIAEIDDIEKFGIEIKKAKSSLGGLTPREIIMKDFKEYEFPNGKVGISQIEIVDFEEANQRKEEILNEMENIMKEKNYDLVLLMVTNIIKGDTDLFCVGNLEKVEKAFNKKVENNSVYLENVMSRKKDIVPKIQAVF